MEPAVWVKRRAEEIGFDLAAVAPAKAYPEHEALRRWLAEGMHAGMRWMESGEAKRLDPARVLPEAKSVIACALNYNTDPPYSVECRDAGRGWIARYAWGEDYHPIMEGMLEELAGGLRQRCPGAKTRCYADTGPVMERVFARHAGLGWIGKNSCLIHPRLGSFLFLGVILTDLELEPDPVVEDYCGKCTACIDACPTEAIVAPGKVDARKCIAYLTIEHRGDIEEGLAAKMGNHIFGCDICQDVCPWNRRSPRTGRPEFQPREGFFNPSLIQFLERVETAYPDGFKKSPLKRAKKEGLRRNVKNALRACKNR